MDLYGSLPCSQEHTTDSNPEPGGPSTHLPPSFRKTYFNP